MNSRVVVIIFVLVVFSFSLPFIRGRSGYVDVTVSEAKNMIDRNPDLVILDARYLYEYEDGHIRNAILIPKDELAGRLEELDKDKETLVYCRSGVRSAEASGILDAAGFTSVYNMLGGILAWMDAGYPVYVRYSSIQQAVNNASNGDTVFVSSGVYYEHLTVNKSLMLVGENRDSTMIDGDSKGSVIYVKATSNVSVRGFTLRESGCFCKGYSGICIENSHDVNITDNVIVHNGFGIKLDWSYKIIVSLNEIIDNFEGITLRNSGGNVFYHNNLVDNTYQARVFRAGPNTWDNGYPSGGNYWSDYSGVDEKSGQYQNVSRSDGIGDTPYFIDEDNQDNYPLMNPFIPPEEMWILYYELLEKYNNLIADLGTLNSTYHILLSNYTQLQENYYSLQNNYSNQQAYFNLLNLTCSNLNATYNELKSEQEATISELNDIRTLMYVFMATTIILVATTVYLTKRKQ